MGLVGAALFLVALGRSFLPWLFWRIGWRAEPPSAFFLPSGLILMYLGAEYLVAYLGIGSDNELYNINADHMAAACAEFLSADQLIYLTDVAGVLDGERVLSAVACQEIERLVQSRVVSGGMVLKLEAAKRAIEGGVRQVRIVGGTTPEALLLASHPGEVACVPGTRVLRHSESAAETAFTAA